MKVRVGMAVAFQQGKGDHMAAVVTGPRYMSESGQQFVNLMVFPDGGEPYCMGGIGPALDEYAYGWKLP